MVKKHKNIQNTWVLWPGIFAKTQKHIRHMGGVTWEVEVYKQKKHKNLWSTLVLCPLIWRKNTKTHKTHDLFIYFFYVEERHKNTQNKKGGCPVHLSFCSWRKIQKHAKYKEGSLCCLGLTTRLQKNPNNTKKINPTKQVLSIVFLHIYTRVLKSTKIHYVWQFFFSYSW